MRVLASRLPLLAMPLLLFAAFFHWAMLDIANVAWLLRGSDNGENALGLHAFLHDPAPGFLRTHLLGAPEGVGLLFTDSNPLLGLLTFPPIPNCSAGGFWPACSCKSSSPGDCCAIQRPTLLPCGAACCCWRPCRRCSYG